MKAELRLSAFHKRSQIMRLFFFAVAAPIFFPVAARAQVVDEIIAKNIQARGGADKLKSVRSLRTTAKYTQGSFRAELRQENKRAGKVREEFIIQGLAQVQAYDGKTGWQISPFGGRKDPELLSQDDLKSLEVDADIDGPLVDYKEKGNKVESLGHDIVDGDDAYKLKVTLKNGDIIYYYLDPDTFLEIRKEQQLFLRGSVQEFVVNLGSYKPVNGVMFPFWSASGPKGADPLPNITFEKIEVNVPLEDTKFAVPATLKAAASKADAQKK
jgi:hypothetical protein